MAKVENESAQVKLHDFTNVKTQLPIFDFTLDDSPHCHQSLRYWGHRTNEISSAIKDVANGFKLYHIAGTESKVAGDEMSESFSKVAKIFEDDPLLHEPFVKFSDALNRIECYREMFMNQTQLLGVEPLANMVDSYKKVKGAKGHLAKQSEILHVAWEKFSQSPNIHTLQEVNAMEKLGHQMLNARHNYQSMMAKYIKLLRENHMVNRVELLYKVLEHMLAQFSFFNFSYQILKEMEPYMSQIFEKLQQEVEASKEAVKKDDAEMILLERRINSKTKSDKSLFPHYDSGHGTFHSSMHSLNTTTGKLFNKVGGFFSSGMSGSKTKGGKENPGTKSDEQEQDWEVIDDVSTKRDHTDSKVEDSSRPESRSSTASPQTDAKSDGDSRFYLSLGENPAKETESLDTIISEHVETSSKNLGEKSDVLKKQQLWKEKSSPKKSIDDLTPEEKSEVLRWAESSSTDDSVISKRGYLRIKQKAFPKNKYPLLYFIIDKENGELLAQGQEQLVPTLFCTLLLSSVREYDTEDAERNFCFQLVTTKDEHTFQALTQSEMKEWMEAIQEAIAVALIKNQERIRSFVRSQSDSVGHRSSSERPRAPTVSNALERIRAVDGNLYCADCMAPRPSWASTNIGVVICIECSGAHRSLGVHISKVKSLTLDRWTEEHVKIMEERGNTKMNSILEGNIALTPKPTRDSSKEVRRQFIIDKYVEKKFAVPSQSENTDVSDLALSSESSEGDESFLPDSKKLQDKTQKSTESVVCLVEGCEVCKNGGHHEDEDGPCSLLSGEQLLPQQKDDETGSETQDEMQHEMQHESNC